MKYNKSEIMTRAWVIFKAGRIAKTFSEALKKAWAAAKTKIERAAKMEELTLLDETAEWVSRNPWAIEEAKKALEWAQEKTGKGADTTISHVLNAAVLDFRGKTMLFKAAMQQVNR